MYRFLFVEDDRLTREQVASYLRESFPAAAVETAENVAEAAEKIRVPLHGPGVRQAEDALRLSTRPHGVSYAARGAAIRAGRGSSRSHARVQCQQAADRRAVLFDLVVARRRHGDPHGDVCACRLS